MYGTEITKDPAVPCFCSDRLFLANTTSQTASLSLSLSGSSGRLPNPKQPCWQMKMAMMCGLVRFGYLARGRGGLVCAVLVTIGAQEGRKYKRDWTRHSDSAHG
jgi:hypothetical protein